MDGGVDCIVLGDDYAHKKGPLIAPQLFREHIAPSLTRIVGNIKAHGAYCVKHTDGNIWEIVDDIVAAGIDALGPLEPAAEMDLSKVKDRYGDAVCVVGNVDVDLLSRGNPQQVEAVTRALMEGVSSRGGHILSSGNSITSSVRPENFMAMIRAGRSYA